MDHQILAFLSFYISKRDHITQKGAFSIVELSLAPELGCSRDAGRHSIFGPFYPRRGSSPFSRLGLVISLDLAASSSKQIALKFYVRFHQSSDVRGLRNRGNGLAGQGGATPTKLLTATNTSAVPSLSPYAPYAIFLYPTCLLNILVLEFGCFI